jgi:hypothetical protein
MLQSYHRRLGWFWVLSWSLLLRLKIGKNISPYDWLHEDMSRINFVKHLLPLIYLNSGQCPTSSFHNRSLKIMQLLPWNPTLILYIHCLYDYCSVTLRYRQGSAKVGSVHQSDRFCLPDSSSLKINVPMPLIAQHCLLITEYTRCIKYCALMLLEDIIYCLMEENAYKFHLLTFISHSLCTSRPVNSLNPVRTDLPRVNCCNSCSDPSKVCVITMGC